MVASKNSSDPDQEFLHLAQHDKFYSRLLSKESSMANPSFRVYYGGATGSVPFLWESQPGTPKTAEAGSSLPPLTPPPSYSFNKKKKDAKKSSPKINNLMQCILPRHSSKRTTLLLPTTPPSSPSVSSSGSSASHRRSRFSSPHSSFSSKPDDDEEFGDEELPTSMLCNGHRSTGKGCYSMMIMKNVLLSMVSSGHGPSQGTAA